MTRVSMRQISEPVQIYFVNTKFNPHQINNSKAVQLVPQIWQEASQARLSIESNKYIYLLVIRNSFFCIVHQTRQICLLAGPKRHQRIFGRWIFWIFGLLFFLYCLPTRIDLSLSRTKVTLEDFWTLDFLDFWTPLIF